MVRLASRSQFSRAAHLLLAILLASVAGRSVVADEPDSSLYGQLDRAAVEILVDGRLAGSGAIVDAKGVVATAAHVTPHPDRRVEICSRTIGRRRAKVLCVDLGHDVALLQIEDAHEEFPALAVAKKAPAAGETVFLFSAAVFRHRMLRSGVVSRKETTFEFYGDQSRFVEVMHIAALIQEGTSGGPWVNRQGELVGVQSGSVLMNTGHAGIANIAPLAAVQSLLQHRQHASTPSLGVFVDELWVLSADHLRRFPQGQDGLVIQKVDARGPGGRAGLRVGEVVTHVEGTAYRYRNDMLRDIRRKAPGATVRLTLLAPDGSGTRQADVQLGMMEVGWHSASGESPKQK